MSDCSNGYASFHAFLPPSAAMDGDGFTAQEIEEALKPIRAKAWHPPFEYTDREIRELTAGARAVTFMGRVANIFDIAHTPKTPRSAKGCLKLCVRDDEGTITVRLWYVAQLPAIRLGSLVSVWTNHISNGEGGTLSSPSAPLFASLFPERDRECHFMIHEKSDAGQTAGQTLTIPLGFRSGRTLNGLMTLQNFIDGGHEVADAKILVVVKSVGEQKRVTRDDQSVVENVNVLVQDDTSVATLGLWGMSAFSPSGNTSPLEDAEGDEACSAAQTWQTGETVLLLQSPGRKFGRGTYLRLTTATLVDVNPSIPDADWLRRCSTQQRSREQVNPAFPENMFDLQGPQHGPIRCLFTLAELDEFARSSPTDTFQGYLSLILTEVKLLEHRRRHTLLCADCCDTPLYANATTATCSRCGKEVSLRLNPCIVGTAVDETAAIAPGSLSFSHHAWRDLLGRGTQELLQMRNNEMQYLADRLLFCRVTVMFGWAGDASKAGGRICVLRVMA